MSQKFVTLKEIAERLKLDRSNVRKIVLKYGFTPMRVRTEESRHQLTLALTEAEAMEFYLSRKRDGFEVG